MFFSDTSDCSAELKTTSLEDETIHNSLFIQIRRNIFGASTMVRLKLVYLPERMEQTFKAEFERAAGLVLQQLFQQEMTELTSNISALKPFGSDQQGITVKLIEERTLAGAFNLIIEAPCGKRHCQSSNPHFKLSLPYKAQAEPVPVAEAPLQQE